MDLFFREFVLVKIYRPLPSKGEVTILRYFVNVWIDGFQYLVLLLEVYPPQGE